MSVSFNGAAVFGPVLAGLLVPITGYAWSFYLNGISFAAVILAVYWLDLPKERRHPAEVSVLRELADGVRYVISREVILTLTIMTAIVGAYSG